MSNLPIALALALLVSTFLNAAEFKVADGYAVNLFASDEQFPDLRAPVQMAFDARGRLWVVTMPSFPHTVPGAQPPELWARVIGDIAAQEAPAGA